MFFDLTEDTFAEQPFGKAALKKLSPVPENFRLYSAGFMGKTPKDWDTMEVVGGEFRHAKSGPNKGKLCILLKGTERVVYVNKTEMAAFEDEKTGD